MELIFSTTAGGNVFSIPKTIPIFLALTDHSSPRVAHLKIPLSLVILNQAKATRGLRIINYRRQAFSPARTPRLIELLTTAKAKPAP
jgi:hypothetical protein